MKRTLFLCLVGLCLIGPPIDASARTLEVQATQVAVIKPAVDSDQVRLLLQFDVPAFLEGRSVDFGCVSFPANCASEEGVVSLQAFALTRAWDEKTVSWEDSWDKAGGDWDNRSSGYSINEAGDGQTVQLDVTDFANDWLKAPSENFGIIVKVSGPFLGTFAVDGAVKPKLRILY